mmetsp:Transcript_13985/g.45644  ORF Transcript_13985/g.45644 Transcript_13985/m.45644 type:complete len:241 (-) Transcript_13985:383-1105(-)
MPNFELNFSICSMSMTSVGVPACFRSAGSSSSGGWSWLFSSFETELVACSTSASTAESWAWTRSAAPSSWMSLRPHSVTWRVASGLDAYERWHWLTRCIHVVTTSGWTWSCLRAHMTEATAIIEGGYLMKSACSRVDSAKRNALTHTASKSTCLLSKRSTSRFTKVWKVGGCRCHLRVHSSSSSISRRSAAEKISSDNVTKSAVLKGLASSTFDARKIDATDASWNFRLPHDSALRYLSK